MENEIIIEKNKQINKSAKKQMLCFAIFGAVISITVLVVAILYFVKVMPRNIAIHTMYPGIALNLLLNGFSMLKVNNKKVAKIDFIISAVVFVVYIVMVILSIVA